MKIAIYIADFSDENLHLMPWRTVFEVLSAMKTLGHDTFLLSGSNDSIHNGVSKEYHGFKAINTPKPFSVENREYVSKLLKKHQIDLLYFPIGFSRNYNQLIQLESNSNCHLVWYVPGGWFKLFPSLKALRFIGFRQTLPYLAQALTPKRGYFRRLAKGGEKNILTMSDYTAEQIRKSGYRSECVFSAPPGKAPLAKLSEKAIIYHEFSQKLDGNKYFLFFGPPNPIRGISHILKAFSIVALHRKDVNLICLFRGDANVDPVEIRTQCNNVSFCGRLFCFWSSVNGADLDLFLKNCFAVLKPFLIVPSEIPLAVIETAGYGKPVIGTGPDGTGAFIDQFGLTVPQADSKALAGAMLRLLESSTLYEQKCHQAKALYERHPDWAAVAKIWLRAGGLVGI